MTSTRKLARNLVVAPAEAHAKVEIYSGVARLARTVWGAELRVEGTSPTTAIVYCHPTANFLGHYALPGFAERGFAAIGMTTRYIGNDSSLFLENCLLDIGSMVRHLKQDLGFEKVVLVGNSGGASIVPYYQSQALNPTVTDPPGGGPDLTKAGLVPADGVCMFMAHPSRALLNAEWLDPAIIDEHQPFERDPELDMYSPVNAPPYLPEFIERYRAGQLARNRRITAWAKGQLRALEAAGHPNGLTDLPFVVHGTTADLRFMDGTIDPSDREIGVSLWGPPAVADYLPAGIGRFTTLRSWINEWSIDDTNGAAERWLPTAGVPVLVLQGGGDVTVHPHHGRGMQKAAGGDAELVEIPGAGHYYENQPELLAQAQDAVTDWIRRKVEKA